MGDISKNTYGGGTPSTTNERYWSGIIPWIQSSDVDKDNLFEVIPRKFITEVGLQNSAAKLIPSNSITVITRVGVGKLAVMPFSFATSQDFLSLSNLETDTKFSAYSMYIKLQKELNSVQGTSIKGITKNELLSMSIMIPKIDEQKRIGEVLNKIDSLITLHQRKYKMLNLIPIVISSLGQCLCFLIRE